MPDIIIHGASGFLGKHFLRKLIAEKIPVVVLARESTKLPGVELNSGVRIFRYKSSLDELKKENLSMNKPVFFELAWQGVFGTERNAEEQLTVNVPMTRSSIELAARLQAAHWIGIGSQAEYGNLDKRISEMDECNPTTLYGKAKLECANLSAK